MGLSGLARGYLRRTLLAVLLLASTWAASAQNITVYVNHEEQKNKASLQAAIEASGVALANITHIEVTGGAFFSSDWEYLRTQKDQLSTLATFVITDEVDYVADSHDTQNGGYFSEALRMVRIAKIKRIGKNTFDRFKEKTNLTTVDLPDATSIAQWAFYECKALSSVSLPKATSVGPMAFYDCFSLSALQLGATPPAVGDDAFKNCPSPRYLQLVDADGKALTGDALTAAQAQYRAHAGWEASTNTWYGWSFFSIKVKLNGGSPITGGSLADAIAASGIEVADITSVEVEGGQFLAGDWEYLNAQKDQLSKLATFTITDGASHVADSPDTDDGGYFGASVMQVSIAKIKETGDNTFDRWLLPTNLTSVSLPDANSIGNWTFCACKALTSVSLPKATSIGEEAFLYCSALTSISLPKATSIGEDAFRSCASLSLLQLGATPPTVKANAFNNCPSPRYLLLVDADGEALAGEALTEAQAKYRAHAGWNVIEEKWYGWTLVTPRIITLDAQNGQIAIEQGAPAGENAHAVVPELASSVSFKLVPSSGYVAGQVVVFETGNEANKIEVTQSSGTYSFAM
ncbi:MAG: leucine-rich repeat domain-containing protein, partial [Bacteroidales bacterium]|nr:leucine-rich repeat domain-containing protein [Bacteroidales bacterium]